MNVEKDAYKKVYNKFKNKENLRNLRMGKFGTIVIVAIGSALGFILGTYASENLVVTITTGMALTMAIFVIFKLSNKNFDKLYEFEEYQKLAIISDHPPIATDYYPFIHLVKKHLKREDVVLWSNIITSFFQEKKLVLTKTDFIVMMKQIIPDPLVDQVYRQYIPNPMMIKEDQYQKLLNQLPDGNIIRWNTFYGWINSAVFSTSPILYRSDAFLKGKEANKQAWDRVSHRYENPESLTTEKEQQFNEDLKIIDQSLQDDNSDILFLLKIKCEDMKISKELELPVDERLEIHENGEITYHEAYFKPSIRAREIVKKYITEMIKPINCIYPDIGKTEGWMKTISNEEYLKLIK